MSCDFLKSFEKPFLIKCNYEEGRIWNPTEYGIKPQFNLKGMKEKLENPGHQANSMQSICNRDCFKYSTLKLCTVCCMHTTSTMQKEKIKPKHS